MIQPIPAEKLLDKFTRIDELLVYLLKEFREIERILGARVTEITVPEVKFPEILPIAYLLIQPRTLIDIIQIDAVKRGDVKVFNAVIPISVPKFKKKHWFFRLPEKWVSIARTPYIFISDYYSPDITLEMFIEEELKYQVTLGAVPLTSRRTIYLDFVDKHYGMDVFIDNRTATDILVTLETSPVWVRSEFYHNIYKPIMDAYRAIIEEMAKWHLSVRHTV